MALYEGRMRGDPIGALERARELLERDAVLEDGALATGVRSFVLAQLGIVELWTGDLDAATAHLEGAHAAAVEEQMDWTALAAGAHLAAARAFRGEIPRAVRQAGEAIELAERRGWSRAGPAGAAYVVQAAGGAAARPARRGGRHVAGDRGEIDRARDRPLRAAHGLNRALLLTDAGESEAALDVLRAAREQLGDWPLLAPSGQHDGGPGRAAPRRGGANGRRRAPCSNGPRARPRPRAPWPTPSPGCACSMATRRRPAPSSRPHLGRPRRRPRVTACPLSVRAESWLLDAHGAGRPRRARRCGTRPRTGARHRRAAGLRRLIESHGAVVGPLLRRHLRHDTTHPAMVGEALDAIERRGAQRSRPSAVLLSEP